VKDVGQEFDEGVVRGAFDRRRGEANQQGVVAGAAESGARSARDHADVDLDARGGRSNHMR
jgi:hypothetical protein